MAELTKVLLTSIRTKLTKVFGMQNLQKSITNDNFSDKRQLMQLPRFVEQEYLTCVDTKYHFLATKI